MKHWPFGGSTAARTLGCPGWRKASAPVPAGAVSEAALKGTALHDIMEEWLERGDGAELPSELFEPEEGGLVTAEDLVTLADTAAEALMDLEDQYDLDVGAMRPEVTTEYAEDVGGSADFCTVSKDRRVVVVGDWKFGQGIMVHPEENAQALFYAWIMREGSEVASYFQQAEQLVLAIIQPNDQGLPALRTWETTPERLDEFALQFSRALELARSDDPPRAVGVHCRFCPAAPICPDRTGQAQRALLMRPDDLELMSVALQMLPSLKDWIKAVEREAHTQMTNGAAIDGFKLVHKSARRQWNTDDSEVIYRKLARHLGGRKKMRTQKLITPTQAIALAKERGVSEERVLEICNTPNTGTTVVPESDRRTAVIPEVLLAAAVARSLS